MNNSLMDEFHINFMFNDKFNRYIKLLLKEKIKPNDPKYKEFHKFNDIIYNQPITIDSY